jgi:hypothetical protein
MNALKGYGSDSSSSEDDSDNETYDEKKQREAEKLLHLKASTSTDLVVRNSWKIMI